MGKKFKPKSGDDEGSRPANSTRKPDSDSRAGAGTSAEPRQDYALFISHSWSYDQEYARFIRLLQQADNFDFRNYSVPEDEQFDTDSDEELTAEIRDKQIRPASVVIVLAGVYSTHSKWIGREIRIAKELGKPILGVEPWGSSRTSSYVSQHADEMVSWNTDSILEGIRKLSP